MGNYRVKDWHKFQHFKDRRPPWIKLYRELLDDPDWHTLDAEASKVLVMLWLIASEDPDQNGWLPDARKLAFRLRTTEQKIKSCISKLSHWVISDDIKVISDRYQVDIPETEGETEGETDKRKNTKKEKSVFKLPDDIPAQAWMDYLDMRVKIKKPATDRAKEMAVKKLYDFRDQGYDMAAVLLQSVFHSWQDLYAIKGIAPVSKAEKKEITIEDLGNTPESKVLLHIFTAMQKKHGDAVFRSWIQPLRVKEIKPPAIILSAPSRFMAEWIKSHYAEDICLFARAISPQVTEMGLEVPHV